MRSGCKSFMIYSLVNGEASLLIYLLKISSAPKRANFCTSNFRVITSFVSWFVAYCFSVGHISKQRSWAVKMWIDGTTSAVLPTGSLKEFACSIICFLNGSLNSTRLTQDSVTSLRILYLDSLGSAATSSIAFKRTRNGTVKAWLTAKPIGSKQHIKP